MNTLSKIATVFVLISVFSFPFFASAAEQTGAKPGSFFYGFTTSFEKINLFFTFNSEKKAEKALKYAEKRLVEAEAVAGDENSDAVKTAIEGYQKNIAIAAEASKKVKDETKAENLLNKIADNSSKHQEVLSVVLSKVPEEAKEAITKALEASRKGQEEALRQISELKQQVTELKEEITELKKQQEAKQNSPQKTSEETQSTTIKELKKEIEELKKQTTEKKENQKQIPPPEIPSASTKPPSLVAPTPTIYSQPKPLTSNVLVLENPQNKAIQYFPEQFFVREHIKTLLDNGWTIKSGYLTEEFKNLMGFNITTLPNGAVVETSTSTPSTIVSPPATPTVPLPSATQTTTPWIKKELKFYSAGCSSHPAYGILCNLEIQYFENTLESVNRKGASIKVSSDDKGKFSTCDCNALGESSSPNLEGNPLTGNTYRSGYDGKPSGFFTYFPDTTSTSSLKAQNITTPHQARTITATANGVTATTIVWWRTDQ